MALKDTIQNDMKAALLGGNRFEGEVLRNLKAAVLNEEVATGRREEGLSDAEIEKIIAREVKKRNESIKLYEENARPELADEEKKEIAVLSTYLPQQLSEDEVRELAKLVIEEMDNVGPSMMGQVIGGVKAKAGTSADGATVARIVKELLNS
ncbi:GatB/YqeY domain-containing protein [Candidatus Saccharibacteria bacterium]|nr:GatB/YqeY domain-containing protein [Candidatus Saccharibacteria bacterium]